MTAGRSGGSYAAFGASYDFSVIRDLDHNAPVPVPIGPRPRGVPMSYDEMASSPAAYGNAEVFN